MIVAVGSNATYLSAVATGFLPAVAVNEYPGTVTSWEGRVQKVRAATVPAYAGIAYKEIEKPEGVFITEA